MRIAFLTTEFPTEKTFAGGLASYLQRTATALAEMEHDVEVFTLSHTSGHIRHGSVMVHRVRNDRPVAQFLKRQMWFWRYGGYMNLLEDSARLAVAARRRHGSKRFEVIQAANYRACGYVAAHWKFAPLATRISSYQPMWRDAYRKRPTREDRQQEHLEIAQLKQSEYVYAPSHLLAETLRQREEIDCDVIEPPCDWPRASHIINAPLPDWIGQPFALFFGTVGLMKGVDRILRVLPTLLEKNHDLSFCFVGTIHNAEDGRPFDQVIQERFSRFGDRVIVQSQMPHKELIPLIRHARVVVLPSRIDNLPNACLEAMSMQRVVVATRNASFEQLIDDGVNGFLVSQNDDEELAATIQHVWTIDDKCRTAIGQAAADSLARLRSDTAANTLVQAFTQVVSKSGRNFWGRRELSPVTGDRQPLLRARGSEVFEKC